MRRTTTIATDDDVDVTGQDDNDDDNTGDDASSTKSDGVDNRNRDNPNRDNPNRDNCIDGNDACASAKAMTLAAHPLSQQGAG